MNNRLRQIAAAIFHGIDHRKALRASALARGRKSGAAANRTAAHTRKVAWRAMAVYYIRKYPRATLSN